MSGEHDPNPDPHTDPESTTARLGVGIGPAPSDGSFTPPPADKGEVHVVHLYPREMSIYGDLGNTRCLSSRLRWHGYQPVVHDHHPGSPWPSQVDLVVGGGGQDSGQVKVQEDLDRIADTLRALAAQDVPMLMICGMYQLLGQSFHTVGGERLPGLGIFQVTTRGNDTRMIGPVVLDTVFGSVVGYENHSGSTLLHGGQEAFGTVRHGQGNNGSDRSEGALLGNLIGSYLHGPILPANPHLADALIAAAANRATGEFAPGEIDDSIAQQAHQRQVDRLLGRGGGATGESSGAAGLVSRAKGLLRRR